MCGSPSLGGDSIALNISRAAEDRKKGLEGWAASLSPLRYSMRALDEESPSRTAKLPVYRQSEPAATQSLPEPRR